MSFCFPALILVAQVVVGYGRSDGTIPSSACESMVPGHSTNSPQTTESPYFVTVASAYFVQNIYLKVDLEAPETTVPFKGYYCQARTDSEKIVGEFNVVGNFSQGHSCRSQQGIFDTISHSDSWSQNPRRRVTLLWKVATPLLENVRIRCSFVQSYSTFWVGVESQDIGPIQNSTYEECCYEEEISSQCSPLCKNIFEPAEDHAINILNNTVYGSGMCDPDSARLALRCSYWAQPGFQLDAAVVRDCCGDEVIDSCKAFCNKNLYAAMSYPDLDYTDCFTRYPDLLYCVLQPVQEVQYDSSSYPIYGTDESPTETAKTTDVYPSSWTTMEEHSNTTTFDVTSSQTVSTGNPSELPGNAVFTIVTTVEVDGAMADATLRENVFEALENDLLIPALDKVQGYIEVRTGVDYYEGSLVVSSEGVYKQQSDGSVPSTNDIQFQLDKRLQDRDDTIAQGSDAWKITPPVDVFHKDINGQCGHITCDDGATCVEVGPDSTTCVCESDSCNADQSGLSTGALIGIIVGVVAFLIIIGIILYVWMRRRSINATKKGKQHRASARSNHSYEDPVYMDISNVQSKPPKLPPDRSVGNLPSNSVTYETPSDDVTKGQEQSFRKISDGYVVGVTKEKTDDHGNDTGEYGYATYDVKGSAEERAYAYNNYDDHHIKTASPTENSANKQNVARYESLSGYEPAVDPGVRL